MNKLTVFTGPMKSGKTEKLLCIYNNYKLQFKNVLLFKPYIDNRFSNTEVKSRNGKSEECYNINCLKDIINNYNLSNIDAIFIDEFQFIKGTMRQLKSILNNCDLFISGLDKTSELKNFKIITKTINIANTVVYLTGDCDICGKPSHYSYYKGHKTGDILIGDGDYLSVCKQCYHVLNNLKEGTV